VSENLSPIRPQVRPTVLPPIVDLGFGGIGGNRLLAGLPPADFELLAPYLDKADFDQGSVLQDPSQPITRVYFVHRGLVSLVALLPDGHAIDACSIGREGAIGLMAGLGAPKAFSRAVVRIPVSASQISVARLAEAAARSQRLREMIIRDTESLLEQTNKLLGCNAVHHVGQRLCRWLLQAHDRTGDDTLPLTQDCLAGLLGVQRTTVTMLERKLQAQGIIHVRRGRIQIRNLDALQRKACGCQVTGRSSNG
jgi:CRP-like cAMP-binding protein